MARKHENNSAGSALLSRFAAQKKKSAIAVGLIAIMAFMWIRVLSGNEPQSAQAAMLAPVTQSGQSQSDSKLNVSFIELPVIKGRHDRLLHNFFEIDGQVFGSGEGVNIRSALAGQEGVKRIAEKLRLEAIGMSDSPEAFINDKIVKAGDTLILEEGSKQYEFEIAAIEKSVVLVKYGTTEIELRLRQPEQAAD